MGKYIGGASKDVDGPTSNEKNHSEPDSLNSTIITDRKKPALSHKVPARMGSIGLALLPLAACGGGGSGPTNNTPPPPPPIPDFTEDPTNTFTARDDNDRTLDQANATADLTVRGLGGNDTITTGSGADIIAGGGGNDTITSGAGADMIRGGEGSDVITAGDGDDVIIVVGTTAAGQYDDADITNPAGSGLDLSSLITLADLNDRTVSEVVSGETIDGGAGNNTLYIYGTVDLTGVTLTNMTTLIVNSDVSLTAEQIAQFTTIDGDGNSVINIVAPDGGGEVILDLSVIDLTDIGAINIQGDITFRIGDISDIAGIGEIITQNNDVITLDVAGGENKTDISLQNIMTFFNHIDVINLGMTVSLIVDESDDVEALGLEGVTGTGIIDVTESQAAADFLNKVESSGSISIVSYEAKISINDIEVNEGDEIATFTVTLEHSTNNAVTVNYIAPDGTEGLLTFAPRETEKTFTTSWNNNIDIELDLSSNALLYNAVGGRVVDSMGELTILDDDGLNANRIVDINNDSTAITENAVPLDIGVSLVGNMSFARDTDVFSITVEAGKAYYIDANVGDEEISRFRDLRIALYREDGIPMSYEDAHYTTSYEDRSSYYYIPEEDGVIYVEVLNGGWSDEHGNYTIEANVVNTNEPDGTADIPEDISSTATLAINETYRGSLTTPVDGDFIAVELTAGETYRFNISDPDTTAQFFHLNLFDNQGLGVTEYYGSSENSDGSWFRDFVIMETGTYFISAKSVNWASIGDYDLTYSIIDTTEPDGGSDIADDITTSAVLEIDVAGQGSLTATGDSDWFKVELDANVIYQFEVRTAQEDVNFYTPPLLDSLGNETNIDFVNSSDDGFYLMQFSVTEAGVYFIPIHGSSESKIDYSVTLTDLTIEEPDGGADFANDISTRGVLEVGGSVFGQIGPEVGIGQYWENRGDWFAVTLEAGETYRFTRSGEVTGGGTQFFNVTPSIYNADGSIIYGVNEYGRNDASVFKASETGIYYIEVEGALGTYTLSAEEINTDEPNGIPDLPDDSSTPVTLTLDQLYDGNMYTTRDVDAFNMNFEAGKIYKITLNAAPGQNFDDAMVLKINNNTQSAESEDQDGEVNFIFTAASTGTSLISITSGNNTGGGWYYWAGNYSIEVSEISFFEPNGATDFGDELSGAFGLTEGVSQEGQLSHFDDKDWFSVQLTEGEIWTFTITGSASDAGSLDYTYINKVLGPDQNNASNASRSWLYNEDNSANDFQFTIVADQTGTYYFEVSENGGYLGSYTVEAKKINHENGGDLPNDNTTSASTAIGEDLQLDISYVRDEDWVEITLEGGHVYEFTVSEDASNFDIGSMALSSLTLYPSSGIDVSPEGISLSYDPELDTFTEIRYIFVPEDSGTYYLSFGNNGAGTGLVNITSREIDAREPDGGNDFVWGIDTRATLDINDVIRGNISYHGDGDLIAVELKAGETYVFDVMDQTNNSVIIGGIHNAQTVINGSQNTIYNSSNTLTITPAESGTYYVSVIYSNGDHENAGSYALTYRNGAVDEPSGLADIAANINTNAVIEVGTPESGSIGDTGNEDWYAVDVAAGTTYEIELEAVSIGAYPDIKGIYDATGTLVEDSSGYYDAETNSSKITWTVEEGGTYYIAVGSGHGIRNNPEEYSLSVDNVGQSASGNYIVVKADLNLDLSLITMVNMEEIDLTGSGDNSLSLTLQDVLDITDFNNQLIISGDAGDSVTSTFQDWVLGADEVIDGETYHTYTSGDATLLVDTDITQDIS